MKDIAKCAGLDCTIKETCRRFTETPTEVHFNIESEWWVYPNNKAVEKKEDCSLFYPNPSELTFPKNRRVKY